MNKNGKKLGIFSFLLFLLTALFTLASQNASAEETKPAVSVTGKFADTITIVNVSNNEGGDLNWDLEQWATFRINATYDLAGKNVKAGDQTTITVPDALVITSSSFEIRDINTNEIIAHATVDAENKKLTLTIQTMLKNILIQMVRFSSMHVLTLRNIHNKVKFLLL